MTTARSHAPTPASLKLAFTTVIVSVALLIAGTLALTVRSAEATVNLGTAESFAVLAGSTITNTGSSTITGDIGLHDGTAFPGYADGADSVTHLDGDLYISDAAGVALAAKNDLTTAYTSAAGRDVTETIGTELGGATLTGGVYDSASGTFEITGTLTLDANGVADTVWIFQMSSSLLAATGSNVVLVDGADACNVFWQVGSSATLNAGATFSGTVMALTSIWVGSGVTVDGRLLARNGEVTLITDTIARSDCAPVVEPSAPPSDAPSNAPSDAPSNAPSNAPSDAPSNAPSDAPPSDAPSNAPPSDAPSNAPPSDAPSNAPPSDAPSNAPPSDAPSDAPSNDLATNSATETLTAVSTAETELPDTGTQQPPTGLDGSSAALIVFVAAAVAGAGWLLLRPQVPVRVRVRRR